MTSDMTNPVLVKVHGKSTIQRIMRFSLPTSRVPVSQAPGWHRAQLTGDMSHELLLFLVRLHPLLVQLPIGGLVLLAFLELVAARTCRKPSPQTSPWTLGFICATALAAATTGWMLANDGGYDAQLLRWHRALGCALMAACLLTFVSRVLGWFRSYRIYLVGTLLLLVAVSHLGGSITHGRDFLTRYAPSFPVKRFAPVQTVRAAAAPHACNSRCSTESSGPSCDGGASPAMGPSGTKQNCGSIVWPNACAADRMVP